MTDLTKLNRFDKITHKEAWGGGEDHPARNALRDIGDTMFACREWFMTYCATHTTSRSIVAMAKLVLAREGERERGVKRGKWERDHRIRE